MRQLLRRFWSDDDGALLSAEWLCLASVAVFGAAVGMANVRNSLNAEFNSFGQGLHSLNQGYQVPSLAGPSGSVTGSSFVDPVGTTAAAATTNTVAPSLYSSGTLPSY